MKHYTEIIPVDLAKKLMKSGMPLFDYPIDGYDGAPAFDIPGPDEPGWEEGHRYRIPTYAEVFDWLISKNLIISIDAVHSEKYFMWISNLFIPKTVCRSFGYRKSFQESADAAIKEAIKYMGE